MKVVVLDRCHENLIIGLKALGFQCLEIYEASKEEVMAQMNDVVGIVLRSRFPIDKSFMNSSPQLRFIGRVGAGMENIDLDYAASKDIQCFRAPEGNRNAVAEHALGMILSLFNNLNRADQEVRSGLWHREENRGVELDGKCVGIIGFGYMGEAFAKKLKGFDVEVIAYDKYKEDCGTEEVRAVSLEELQDRADVVSFHVPIQEDTHYYLNSEFIARMKKDFYLINTARGEVVETAALVDGLESGKILGACLDVLEYEKKSFENLYEEQIPEPLSYLIDSDRVVLSSHIAGWTQESKRKMAEAIVHKVGAWMRTTSI